MKVTVEITRRPEIADPEGTTIQRALADLGHNDVVSVRVDRVIHLDVTGITVATSDIPARSALP